MPLPAPIKPPDHAASYYHASMARLYEEMASMYGRSEYANKAIDEYRQAIVADPSSEYLNAALAELYSRTGRIRDAVMEAQEILQRDPNNLEAHRLLGRIYLRSLGDSQGQSSEIQSQEVLKLAIEQYEALARLEPKNGDNHLMLGGLYVINRDLTKAEGELKIALQADPNSEEAVTQLARIYNEQNNPKLAIETINAVPEAARTSKMYAALGATYELQKDYKNAVSAYQRAVTLDKDNLDAMRGLAQNLANDNQMEAALSAYKTFSAADPQDWQALVEMSRIYRHMGKFDQAIDSLKHAEASAPESLEIVYEESIVLEAQGKFDDAAALLQKLINRTTSPDGNYNAGERQNRALFMERLGTIYKETGRPLLALESFKKMTELGGDEASRGYQEMVDAYRDQKQWGDATKVAQDAVRKLPDDKSLRMTLALQLADDNKPEDAIKLAKSTLKGDKTDRETYVTLSQIYMRLKRWKDAEEALNESDKLASRPEEKAYVQYYQGMFYERQKKYDQAEQAFKQILVQDPNNPPTLNYLGYMLADHNMRLEEAFNMIKHAVELDPQNGAYLDSLGWVYFKLGKYDEAEDNLRRAAEKTPYDATIQDHLGELYAKTGKLKLAATHWERALTEWNRSIAADVDQQDVSRVQKKLESTKVKLAQQKQ
ncbi:MAG TPA: tetratricopeptide repeat protein [Candidatus Angelobacter sp.]|nr:tetratricopeptide repeat protein [Candidatus Angelobacter sp.]